MDATQVGLDYWLEPLSPESLPMLAAQLLADGYESPALRESAGMPADDVAVREVFVEALRQLGVYVTATHWMIARRVRRHVDALQPGPR